MFWWIIETLTIILFETYRRKVLSRDVKFPLPVKVYYGYVLFAAVYGIFMSDGYWDYKFLVHNLIIYSICLSYSYLCVPNNISQMSYKWCKMGIIGIWLLLPVMQLEAIGKFLVPFSFLVILWPLYKGQWKYVVLFFAAAVFLFGTLAARSTAMRFAAGFLFSFFFIFPKLISVKYMKLACGVLLIVPFVLFYLGVTGVFNIWNLEENASSVELTAKGSFDESSDENLKADTRTFIYYETITSALKYNYVIQGHSLARGYESPFFADTDLLSRGERASCEVAVLNIFTRMGIIGVVLYFSLFVGAIVNVFKHSKNKYLYVFALYMAFRWCFSWMEDIARFDLMNLYIWVVFSMCYSPYFINMSDEEFENWARGIFKTKRLF